MEWINLWATSNKNNKKIWLKSSYPYFCTPKTKRAYCFVGRKDDSVAQLVEQYTFNVWVLGSNPSRITKNTEASFLGGFFYISFMPAMYILYSVKINKYYVGACTDLQRRLYEHNIGHSKFTSTGMPWEVKYTEEFDSLIDAKKRETEIKKKKSRKYIEYLIGG